jgi:hypothetical protein
VAALNTYRAYNQLMNDHPDASRNRGAGPRRVGAIRTCTVEGFGHSLNAASAVIALANEFAVLCSLSSSSAINSPVSHNMFAAAIR